MDLLLHLAILNLEADEKFITQKIRKFEKKEKEKFERINYFIEEIEQTKIVKLYDELIREKLKMYL